MSSQEQAERKQYPIALSEALGGKLALDEAVLEGQSHYNTIIGCRAYFGHESFARSILLTKRNQPCRRGQHKREPVPMVFLHGPFLRELMLLIGTMNRFHTFSRSVMSVG